jgi:hypothetical protein
MGEMTWKNNECTDRSPFKESTKEGRNGGEGGRIKGDSFILERAEGRLDAGETRMGSETGKPGDGFLASIALSESADSWEGFERRLILKTRLDDGDEGDGVVPEPPLTLLLNLSTVFSTTLDSRLTRLWDEERSFCVWSGTGGSWLAMRGGLRKAMPQSSLGLLT